MKKNFTHRLCGIALAGLFVFGGMIAIPNVFPTTAVMAEVTPDLTETNTEYYNVAYYCINGPEKGHNRWVGVYSTPNDRDNVVAFVLAGAAAENNTYIILDVNHEFRDDTIWNTLYSGPYNKSTGTFTNEPFRTYYNDMVASYPQLKEQIKNGWYDLSYGGIQKLIASGVLPADCLVGRYSKAGTATTATTATATTTSTTTDTSTDSNIKKLQAAVVELTVHPATVYNGVDYSKEFNAAYYYIANPDLQSAIGINAQALLQHYVMFGKKEGRLSIAK